MYGALEPCSLRHCDASCSASRGTRAPCARSKDADREDRSGTRPFHQSLHPRTRTDPSGLVAGPRLRSKRKLVSCVSGTSFSVDAWEDSSTNLRFMRALGIIYAFCFLLAGMAALAFGLKSTSPWLIAGIASMLWSRSVRWFIYLSRRNGILLARDWRIVAILYIVAGCLFATSMLSGEGWWGLLGVLFEFSMALVLFTTAKRSTLGQNTQAGSW